MFYPITLQGQQDTIDDFATMSFHLVLISASDVYVSEFNSYGEDCCDHAAGSESLTSLHSCAGLSWSHWFY